ncbi:MAG: cytochrome c biogenesis protein ResB [Planctomycetes bacterium]|nr:cytochrome c biogenesis protein ResB [Planctomycetota bacterium]
MKPKEINKLANSWTFKQATLCCLLLYLWAEALVGAATTVVRQGAPAAASATMFALLLPMFWLLVYRWFNVIAFFRSVRVAVTNMCFLALGAMIGVLIQQEDVNFPAPDGALQELVALAEQGDSLETAPSAAAKIAYQQYEGFREAQAFFVYHLANNIGLRNFIGFDGPQAGDEKAIAQKLLNLEARLPEIAARFGEEKAVAIRSQSEVGLRTRAKNAEIRILEQRLDDTWFSLFVIADQLDLRRTYRSDWYSMMWAILFFGVLASLLRNGIPYLLKRNKWGFAVTHLGILLLIIGGLIGRSTEIRGIVELNIGQSKSNFRTWTNEPKSFVYNPVFADSGSESFAIQLDDFRADQHDVLDVIYVEPSGSENFRKEFDLDSQPKLRVFSGLKQSFDYPADNLSGDPAFTIEVLEYAAQSTVVRAEDGRAVESYTELGDASFFNPAPATILLKTTGLNESGVAESNELLLHASGSGHGVPYSYYANDGTHRIVWLNFREDRDMGGMPLEWQSKLSIIEYDADGLPHTVAGGEVRVNDYFVHGGYRFFQTNHNPNDPTYSGIGIVYDPGIPLVLWGLYCVMIATAYIFLVWPLISGSKTRGAN